ncbi:E3 ubiquitin-protein ligase Zswim2 [Madurella mycetomatis]|uniref:E3 ubiquitin-protein ligase Zswim2 n=1 Tax=Madurella mycetomatis TaxID=100816 RepID=A0A175W4Z6_9PEZI|nr:E3 ubiquitin-protein ligase Zswim2 [Madurella mycetomatis]
MGAHVGHGHGEVSPATAPSPAKKRKHNPNCIPTSRSEALHGTSTSLQLASPFKKPRNAKLDSPATEKRLRRYRPKPPQSFLEVHQRATTQRFYVLSRARAGTSDCPEERVELTGSTGNIYTVVITRQPTCDCPHAREGNQCKHVLYVLSRVLRARYEYVYQLALLSTELKEIFAGAPPPVSDGKEEEEEDRGGKRKPVEGDCPICFCEMGAAGSRAEAVVWCRAACGQNIHEGCFETWAATKRRQGGGGEVTCPYCRSVWEGDEDMVKKIKRTGKVNGDGYVNVADQLGISTQRDYSTYSRWWSGHPSSYRRGDY